MPLFNIAASAPSIPHSRLIFQERISCPLYVLFLTRKQNLPIVSLVYSQIMYSLKTSLSSLDCSMIAENRKASAFLSSVFDFLRRSKCQTQVILCYCLHVLQLQFGEQIIESYQFFLSHDSTYTSSSWTWIHKAVIYFDKEYRSSTEVTLKNIPFPALLAFSLLIKQVVQTPLDWIKLAGVWLFSRESVAKIMIPCYSDIYGRIVCLLCLIIFRPLTAFFPGKRTA